MKEKIIWAGEEYEMEWFDEKNFLHLSESKIKQVYGFLFDGGGKIVLVRPTKKRGWRLPGGGPEKEDRNWKETLIREADEEADVEVDKAIVKAKGKLLGENAIISTSGKNQESEKVA